MAMHELKIFESPEFGTVRTVTINGEPWLVGKDVAEALGYSKPHKAISCYVDGKTRPSPRSAHLAETTLLLQSTKPGFTTSLSIRL